MTILDNYSLLKHNTFGINFNTKYYVEILNIQAFNELINDSRFINENHFILGSGSNVLFCNDYNGIIIHLANKGIRIIQSNDDSVIVEAAAGELWHDFVLFCLNNKLYGSENLALIPGSIGAAPVQNIGAYGVEQKDIFYKLTGYNLQKNQFEEYDNFHCNFSYRNSIFKNQLKNNFIVFTVQYKLSKKPNINLTYKELQKELNNFNILSPTPENIFDIICRIRQSKLPDYNIEGNAGSFFKNPIINKSLFENIIKDYPAINAWETEDGNYKVSAAWLIENTGWKGKRINDAGVSTKHSLILVNYNTASGNQIYELSENISDSVQKKFAISLEKEVIIIK